MPPASSLSEFGPQVDCRSLKVACPDAAADVDVPNGWALAFAKDGEGGAKWKLDVTGGAVRDRAERGAAALATIGDDAYLLRLATRLRPGGGAGRLAAALEVGDLRVSLNERSVWRCVDAAARARRAWDAARPVVFAKAAAEPERYDVERASRGAGTRSSPKFRRDVRERTPALRCAHGISTRQPRRRRDLSPRNIHAAAAASPRLVSNASSKHRDIWSQVSCGAFSVAPVSLHPDAAARQQLVRAVDDPALPSALRFGVGLLGAFPRLAIADAELDFEVEDLRPRGLKTRQEIVDVVIDAYRRRAELEETKPVWADSCSVGMHASPSF